MPSDPTGTAPVSNATILVTMKTFMLSIKILELEVPASTGLDFRTRLIRTCEENRILGRRPRAPKRGRLPEKASCVRIMA